MTSKKPFCHTTCPLHCRGIQFALFGDRLLAADEHSAIRNHGDGLRSVKIEDDSLSPKSVYGVFKPQPFLTEEEAVRETLDNVGCTYGILREDHVLSCGLTSIAFRDPYRLGHAVNYPFAAEILTTLEIDNEGLANTELDPDQFVQWSIPFFLLYGNLSPARSLLNRPGILCVCEEEHGKVSPQKADRYARIVW